MMVEGDYCLVEDSGLERRLLSSRRACSTSFIAIWSRPFYAPYTKDISPRKYPVWPSSFSKIIETTDIVTGESCGGDIDSSW